MSFVKFTELPEDIITIIIKLTTNCIAKLSIVCKYFNTVTKPLKITTIPFPHGKFCVIQNNNLYACPNLTYLDTYELPKLTPQCINSLINLKTLKDTGGYITYVSISKLTNLTTLWMGRRSTSSDIASLTNLEELSLNSHKKVRDFDLEKLVNLKKLNLTNNKLITNDCIKQLTNLAFLNLCRNTNITDTGLVNLTSLKSLVLCDENMITNKSVSQLTNLTELILRYNSSITMTSINQLPKLKTIDLYENDIIPVWEIRKNPSISIGRGTMWYARN